MSFHGIIPMLSYHLHTDKLLVFQASIGGLTKTLCLRQQTRTNKQNMSLEECSLSASHTTTVEHHLDIAHII